MVCGDGGVACVCPSVCGCASGIRGRIVCVIVCVLVCVCVCAGGGARTCSPAGGEVGTRDERGSKAGRPSQTRQPGFSKPASIVVHHQFRAKLSNSESMGRSLETILQCVRRGRSGCQGRGVRKGAT